MSEINRVPLTCVSQASSNKTKNVIKKTIRISIKLPQSNENTCPEYNYQDELDAVKRKSTSKGNQNGRVLDMLDDDDDVRRIALEMEQKYGKGNGVTKKKHKSRKDDYADIGMGYDESDSFIDNTDGYDEIIPKNVTTLHGGFYINAGALEFKTDDEESDESSNDGSSSSSHSRKRSLDSEGSDEEEGKPKQSKKLKIDTNTNGMQKALKKKLFSPNKILKKKRPQNIHKKTVSELLKEKRKDLNLSAPDSVADKNSETNGAKKSMENGKNVSNSISDAIESVVKGSEENVATVEKISSQINDSAVKPVALPENLPKNIIQSINSIKEKGANGIEGDKFPKEINVLLTGLERKSKFLGKPSKYKVYEHLSFYLKVDKQVLIDHCNQLALKDEQNKIESLLRDLKAEIDKLMPSIITTYERECELVIERRNQLLQLYPEGDEKRKAIGRPKRKFQWNDATRKYLKDTAIIKKRSFLNQNNSIESWEEELNTFLKNKVIHLWPEGWMTMTALTKVCNKLFSEPNSSNQSSSGSKKESNKVTAISNTPNSPYPNISITPVINNVQSKPSPKTSPTEKNIEAKKEKTNNHSIESTQKDYNRENIPREHNNHKEPLQDRGKTENKETCSDKRNNNANTFFKVDYDKVQSGIKPIDFVKDIKEAKLPKVSIIELDGPTDFSNILPKTKLNSKNEFDKSNTSKIVAGESSCHKKERTLIINDVEVTKGVKSQEDTTQLNLTDGDDIQKVMEHLKTLQQMSSPVKPFDGSSCSNSSFSQKTSGLLQNNVGLVATSFQDEYQKQLSNLNALGNLSASTSKSNYKCS